MRDTRRMDTTRGVATRRSSDSGNVATTLPVQCDPYVRTASLTPMLQVNATIHRRQIESMPAL
jgi:hypothetical protein